MGVVVGMAGALRRTNLFFTLLGRVRMHQAKGGDHRVHQARQQGLSRRTAILCRRMLTQQRLSVCRVCQTCTSRLLFPAMAWLAGRAVAPGARNSRARSITR